MKLEVELWARPPIEPVSQSKFADAAANESGSTAGIVVGGAAIDRLTTAETVVHVWPPSVVCRRTFSLWFMPPGLEHRIHQSLALAAARSTHANGLRPSTWAGSGWRLESSPALVLQISSPSASLYGAMCITTSSFEGATSCGYESETSSGSAKRVHAPRGRSLRSSASRQWTSESDGHPSAHTYRPLVATWTTGAGMGCTVQLLPPVVLAQSRPVPVDAQI